MLNNRPTEVTTRTSVMSRPRLTITRPKLMTTRRRVTITRPGVMSPLPPQQSHMVSVYTSCLRMRFVFKSHDFVPSHSETACSRSCSYHLCHRVEYLQYFYVSWVYINSIPLIPACTARPGLPLSPPEIAFLESPYYPPQTASIADRHHPTNFHSVTYTQNDDAAFEAGSDNDHKSFLRMRVIFKVEYPAELFRFRRVLDDILSSFDVF